MDWVFPKNEGGRDSGFHDAGVETFKGNFDRYLARELIQNSLDARSDSNNPVHVKFELLSLDKEQIPGINSLRLTFRRCAEYWENDEKALSFFQKAETTALKRRIFALKISDYNTSGVPGEDKDRMSNWYHLVRCAGSSSKWGGEGGSFGIGKNAPFAASQLRTVLYSTKTADGSVAFQGVSTLVSHALPNGFNAQPIGFLGNKSGESIRKLKDIPEIFRRIENGLDITVLGYPAAETWQNDLIHSVLDNFWPAIDFGDLIVSVDNITIDKVSLPKLLHDFSNQEDFTAHLFYQAYKTPTLTIKQDLAKLSQCNMFLLSGDMDLPKKVAMIRKTGMVIFQRQFRSIIPFCGVFLCTNETGNRLLRDMEPPRHDIWDPDHPESGASKNLEREYVSFVRECVKKLLPTDDTKIITIPELSRFLPDDEETPEESFGESETTKKEETSTRSPLPETISGRKIDPKKRNVQQEETGIDEGQEGEDGDTPSSGGSNGNNTKKGKGDGGGGGNGNKGSGTEEGNNKGEHSKPAVPLFYRSFMKSADGNKYTLIVAGQTKEIKTVKLVLSTVGDDQKALISVESAKLADGAVIPVHGQGTIGPIKLDDTRQKIELSLSERGRVSLEVSAHEA